MKAKKSTLILAAVLLVLVCGLCGWQGLRYRAELREGNYQSALKNRAGWRELGAAAENLADAADVEALLSRIPALRQALTWGVHSPLQGDGVRAGTALRGNSLSYTWYDGLLLELERGSLLCEEEAVALVLAVNDELLALCREVEALQPTEAQMRQAPAFAFLMGEEWTLRCQTFPGAALRERWDAFCAAENLRRWQTLRDAALTVDAAETPDELDPAARFTLRDALALQRLPALPEKNGTLSWFAGERYETTEDYRPLERLEQLLLLVSSMREREPERAAEALRLARAMNAELLVICDEALRFAETPEGAAALTDPEDPQVLALCSGWSLGDGVREELVAFVEKSPAGE